MAQANDEIILCQSGTLVARLSRQPYDMLRAQQLRYNAFACAAHAPNAQLTDSDDYDSLCQHLLVCDTALPEAEQVVGTYRLISQQVANNVGSFYSASEFNLTTLVSLAQQQNWRLLEVGRSCVREDYRTKGVMPLLWQALAIYLCRFNVDVLFGCASFATTNVDEVLPALRYLAQHHAANPAWQVHAHAAKRLAVPPFVGELLGKPALPPLIKGYLRLGGKIADGAVLDAAFGTIDVCVLVPTANIPQRYHQFFGTDRAL